MRSRGRRVVAAAGCALAIGASGVDASAATAVVPHALDKTSITAPPNQIIGYGETATLSTTLIDTTTSQPITAAEVDLLARPADSTQFSQIASATTGDDGVATVLQSPTETTSYKWTYAGDDTHHLATSTDGITQVAQIVHAHLSKHKVKHRKHVDVYGTVKPGGKFVHLQRLKAGEFVTFAGSAARVKRQTLPNGKDKVGFVLPYTPKHPGTVTLRVVSDDDSLNAGNVSKQLTLTVH
jgi:5-hydroxyisourate hydrolase-like protein (transthyretin family)